MALVSRKFFLRRSRMLEFLAELEKSGNTAAKSLYLPPELSRPEIEDWQGKIVSAHSLPQELTEAVVSSRTGAVVFWGEVRKCLILPPFPVREKTVFDGYVAEPLRRLLQSNFRIGLILVHLGAYAIGLGEGEKLLSSKVGTGLVHARHKKGGSSQARFQRRREMQAQEFLDRVCLHAREHLEPQAGLLDYIVYGGPHHTVLRLRKRCPFLNSLEDRALPLLEVASPRQKILATTVGRIWSSRVMEWQGS